MNVTGQVEEIISREVETKFGVKPVYDVVMGGKKYGHGFNAPTFKEGDTVSFDVDVKQNGKYTNYNIRPETVRAGVESAVASAPSEGYDRNRSIVRQNSLAHATNLVIATGVGSAEKAAELAVEVARVFEAYSMCEDE